MLKGLILMERTTRACFDSTDFAGLFLVRDSTNFVGDFTLCVSFQSKVEHYRIIAGRAQNTNKKNYTIDEDEYFDDLISLVRHYRYDVLF